MYSHAFGYIWVKIVGWFKNNLYLICTESCLAWPSGQVGQLDNRQQQTDNSSENDPVSPCHKLLVFTALLIQASFQRRRHTEIPNNCILNNSVNNFNCFIFLSILLIRWDFRNVSCKWLVIVNVLHWLRFVSRAVENRILSGKLLKLAWVIQ